MHLAGRPVAAFDPEGLIFAAGINSESVKLYDLRSFDKGPFSSFKFTRKCRLPIASLGWAAYDISHSSVCPVLLEQMGSW